MKEHSLLGARQKTKVAPRGEFPNEEVFLQPWYLPRDVFLAVRRILPNIHLSKMRFYFEDYGCLKCGTREALYGSNGLCERCNVLIRGRVVRALKRRLKKVGVVGSDNGISDALGTGMDSAQALLRDFPSLRGSSRKSGSHASRPSHAD